VLWLHTGARARIDFRRTIAIDRSNPVIYCAESAENLSCL